MTFRELATEVMAANGVSREEVAYKMKLASTFMPGVDVDREIPPEDLEPLREHLMWLHNVAVANMDQFVEFMREQTDRLRAKN